MMRQLLFLAFSIIFALANGKDNPKNEYLYDTKIYVQNFSNYDVKVSVFRPDEVGVLKKIIEKTVSSYGLKQELIEVYPKNNAGVIKGDIITTKDYKPDDLYVIEVKIPIPVKYEWFDIVIKPNPDHHLAFIKTQLSYRAFIQDPKYDILNNGEVSLINTKQAPQFTLYATIASELSEDKKELHGIIRIATNPNHTFKKVKENYYDVFENGKCIGCQVSHK